MGLLLGGLAPAAQEQAIDETQMEILPGTAGQGEQDAQSAAEGAPVTVSTLTWVDYARMLGILAGVVGLIYLVFFFLKKAGGQSYGQTELIRLRGSRPMGNNRSLHLVEVGNQVFLVGNSEGGGLSRIAEITDKETLDDIRLRASREEQAGAGGAGFAQLFLSKLRGNSPSLPSSESSVKGSADFIKNQRERLKDLE